ncbi:MAG: penicillin-binding transpeptidase domain-containing protein [Caldimonas sp.]
MPPPKLEERLPAITPQLAVRVAVLGGIAFALFAIIFFRLWFLQVLSGDDYVTQARENRVRKIKIEAPRGDIVDRDGTSLVRTRVAPVVQIVPGQLPEAERVAADEYRELRSAAERARLAARTQLRDLERDRRQDDRRYTRTERVEHRRLARASGPVDVTVPKLSADPALRATYRRLGRAIGLTPRTIHRRVVEGIAEAPYSNVTIKTDVPSGAFNYLKERQEEFPGVVVEKLYLRSYPHKTLGAQLFGTLREISTDELAKERYRDVEPGTRIGKDGIEETYDRYLRGTNGYTRVVINALGDRDDRRAVTRREPKQGQRLRLTLDLDLQRASNDALRQAIGAANGNGNPAKAGAYVAMDPTNGEVLALGSYPSFDANLFAKPLSQKTFDRLNSEEEGAPLFNRAIAAAYPTGSTFKPITAMAALQEGILTPSQTIFDDGELKIGPQSFKNAKDAKYGLLTLPKALQVSSDVFFYTLGERANSRGPIIQRWARRLSLGHRTGIDLPGEFDGLVPDRKWRDSGYAKYEKCIAREHVPARTTAALLKCGGIERPWSTGDNVNLSVGQGDLQATPLQLATAYAAIANGGRIVRPRLAMSVEDGLGRVVEEFRSATRRREKFAEANRATIMDGLRRAAGEEGGTSADVFDGFAGGKLAVYGKTGTVERTGQADQSWYAAYVPHPTRPIVVVTTLEKGGFGAETAAPAARLILSEWFDLGEDKFRAGSSKTL